MNTNEVHPSRQGIRTSATDMNLCENTDSRILSGPLSSLPLTMPLPLLPAFLSAMLAVYDMTRRERGWKSKQQVVLSYGTDCSYSNYHTAAKLTSRIAYHSVADQGSFADFKEPEQYSSRSRIR